MSRKYMLVLGILSFCLLMAVTSPALATTRKTRISGLSTSVTALSYKDTGTLTYARSGRNYAIAGQYVKVYRYIAGRWVYQSKVKTSTRGRFSVSKPAGYTYKFAYAGVRGRYYSCSWRTKVNPVATGVDTDPDTLALLGGDVAYVSGNLWMVSGASRVPLAASVTISQDGTTAVVTAVADESGMWMAELPGGDYRVTYAGDRTHCATSSTFSVAIGAMTELTSEAGSYVVDPVTGTSMAFGQVRSDYGTQGGTWSPIAGATLSIYAADGTTALATTVSDGEGAWSAALPVGSYRVEYAAAPGFVAGDGVRYNMSAAACEFSVGLYPMVEAWAEVAGSGEYGFGTTATGTFVIRDGANAPIALNGPATLTLLAWDDTAGEDQAGDYVVVDTVTTDAEGNWAIDGLADAGDYILSFDEDPDYVSGGVHYHVLSSDWNFLITSAPAPEI